MGVSIGFGVGPVRLSKRIGGGRKRRSSGNNAAAFSDGVNGLIDLAERYEAKKSDKKIAAQNKEHSEVFAPALDAARAAHGAAYDAELRRSGDRDAARAAGRAAHGLVMYQELRGSSSFKVDPEMEARIAERDGMLVSAAAWREAADQGLTVPAPAPKKATFEERMTAVQERNKAKTAQLRADRADREDARRQRWAARSGRHSA